MNASSMSRGTRGYTAAAVSAPLIPVGTSLGVFQCDLDDVGSLTSHWSAIQARSRRHLKARCKHVKEGAILCTLQIKHVVLAIHLPC